MPQAPTVLNIIQTVVCCSLLKRRQAEEQAQEDTAQPTPNIASATEATASTPPQVAASSDQGQIFTSEEEHITSSEDAQGEPTEEQESEEQEQQQQEETGQYLSDDIPSSPPVIMFSPLSLYRIEQAASDLQDLKYALPPSSTANTRVYRDTILLIYEILQRDEIMELFGLVGSYYITEKLRIVETVLELAYWDVDSGGDSRLVAWIERELGELVEANPTCIPALTLSGRSWLLRAQQYLSRISDDGSGSNANSASSHGSYPAAHEWTSADEDRDAAEHDRRREESNYVDARTCLIPAVEFLRRAVHRMERTGQGGTAQGDVYVLQAEINMSLGNVMISSQAQRYFRAAVEALRKASLVEGFVLPEHLERYLQSFEYVLY